MILTRTVLSRKALVLGNVVFDVSCIKPHLCVSGLMHQNTHTMSVNTGNNRYLDRMTKWNRSRWSGVPFQDKPNVICCRE